MSRKTITNAILAEKIDHLHEKIDEIKPEIKANTEFRLQAKGVIGLATFIAGLVGGAIMWILSKVWK